MRHTEREIEDREETEKERVSGSLTKKGRLLQARSLQFEVEYISG